MLKKYFWLINLILVTSLVWICVDVGMTVISHKLESENGFNQASSVSARDQGPKVPSLSKYQPIIENNVFNPGDKPRKVSTDTKQEKNTSKQEEASFEDSGDLPPTELHLTLKGTAVLEPPINSFAIIYDHDKRRQKLYNLGDTIQDATIKNIYANRVILQRGEKLEALFLKRKMEKKSSRASKRSRGTKKKSGVIRSSNRDHYVLDREKVSDMISNVNQFMTQVRVSPHFHEGKPVGYRVSDIKQGSLIEEIGIKNGDIIKSVNGLPIAKPDQAFEAYQQLMEESQITLELQRGRADQVITYELK